MNPRRVRCDRLQPRFIIAPICTAAHRAPFYLEHYFWIIEKWYATRAAATFKITVHGRRSSFCVTFNVSSDIFVLVYHIAKSTFMWNVDILKRIRMSPLIKFKSCLTSDGDSYVITLGFQHRLASRHCLAARRCSHWYVVAQTRATFGYRQVSSGAGFTFTDSWATFR